MLLAVALSFFAFSSPVHAQDEKKKAAPQPKRPTQQEVMAATSLAVSLNLAKVCPRQFALTKDKEKLREGERLKNLIGHKRFKSGLDVMQAPGDCSVARSHAEAVKANLPFSVLR